MIETAMYVLCGEIEHGESMQEWVRRFGFTSGWEGTVEAKAQEANLWLCCGVNDLAISEEQVQQYGGMFLSAIKWYEADQMYKDKRNGQIMFDREYSLFFDLRENIQRKEEITSGPLIRFMQAILSEHQAFLLQMKEKPWIRRETVDSQLAQMQELTRNNDLQIE